MYRGADKSLARPGRKQVNVSVRMVWISFGALPCRGGKKLGDSSRPDVVEIARVPDMLPSLFTVTGHFHLLPVTKLIRNQLLLRKPLLRTHSLFNLNILWTPTNGWIVVTWKNWGISRKTCPTATDYQSHTRTGLEMNASLQVKGRRRFAWAIADQLFASENHYHGSTI